jgi:hypothetical protein
MGTSNLTKDDSSEVHHGRRSPLRSPFAPKPVSFAGKATITGVQPKPRNSQFKRRVGYRWQLQESRSRCECSRSTLKSWMSSRSRIRRHCSLLGYEIRGSTVGLAFGGRPHWHRADAPAVLIVRCRLLAFGPSFRDIVSAHHADHGGFGFRPSLMDYTGQSA